MANRISVANFSNPSNFTFDGVQYKLPYGYSAATDTQYSSPITVATNSKEYRTQLLTDLGITVPISKLLGALQLNTDMVAAESVLNMSVLYTTALQQEYYTMFFDGLPGTQAGPALSADFLADAAKLTVPSTGCNITKSAELQRYKDFFSVWGTHFVCFVMLIFVHGIHRSGEFTWVFMFAPH